MSFSQRDSRWASKQLGNSPYTMGGYGCLVTAIADWLVASGIDTDPGRLCDAASALHMFGPDGMLSSWRLSEIFPGFQMIASEETDLEPGAGHMPLATAIQNIKDAHAAGNGVILHLDLSPHNSVNEGDHFAREVDWNKDDPTFQDPWWGFDGTLSQAHDGLPGEAPFAGYGSPEKAIYGYRIYTLNHAQPMSLKLSENTKVFLAEANGGWGLYMNGKLYIDDLAKIDSLWQLKNAPDGFFRGGHIVGVTLKDWNAFPHVNLKNEPLP